MPQLTVDQLTALLAQVFPQISDSYSVLSVDDPGSRVRLDASDRHLRPGGTVSGPALFGLVDLAMYVAVMARVGPETLAVTTSANIDFLRKPPPGALVAEAHLLKLGTRLAVGDVLVHAQGMDGPVARAALTYSLPPRRG